ncbi:hypothetical protein ACFQVC_36645 [Streptomyces monticola]|uniref:PE-PGRS family protein n=1 Tax=Streptomyces monticola TaxID=2666263 RepID=A0ABW2JU76_9ACTN
MTDARSPLRAFRAALFAAVCVALAALGHSYMSGHDIPFGALLGAFGITAGLAWCVGGSRRGVPSIAAGLLAVQGALHLIFAGSQSHAGAAAHGAAAHQGSVMSHGPTPHDGASMPHGGAMAYEHTGAMSGHTTAAYEHSTAMSGHTTAAPSMADDDALMSLLAGHSSAGMLAAHLVAALVCALWLARGEAAFFQLVAALGALAFTPLRLLLTVVRLPEAARTVRRPRRRPRSARPRAAALAYAVTRRGPPAVVLLHRYAPTAA